MPGATEIRSVQSYWDETSASYDEAFTHSVIGRAERSAVWRELDGLFQPGQHVLELNCGTGVDAVHLAESGVRVLACDLSPGMITLACRRRETSSVRGLLDFRVLATEGIGALTDEGPFDGAFSDFAGLNCVQDLSGVARALGRLLRPGARMLFCMLGRYPLWDMTRYAAHGEFHKATERLRPGGTIRRLADGGAHRVQYPSPGTLARTFAPEFRLRRLTGIGISLPPFFMEPRARRLPRLLAGLEYADRWLGRVPLLRLLAGHVLLEFQRL
jgi:SAM-dependent methyltransferase